MVVSSHVCTFVHMHVCVHACECVHTCMCACACVCMYEWRPDVALESLSQGLHSVGIGPF